jgi:hypothetical protein
MPVALCTEAELFIRVRRITRAIISIRKTRSLTLFCRVADICWFEVSMYISPLYGARLTLYVRQLFSNNLVFNFEFNP